MGNAYYCIMIAVWCTLFVESWKRKQNVIANKWLMRDFHDPTIERREYKASLTIDGTTKNVFKKAYHSSYLR